ncbi:cyclin-dependent kinase inhibitor 1 isoform X2 [Harpegnathos saltator]|uniref:cyclin-dependent kinase inhibitor 1 isoform X2 n=1 Tax=Harpegnathos saltator TaxID=610380 RepID=UPI00058F5C2B|nr:cyclin-dependent kinase inhibitor 1 isoform X2 [Harpegnathos saltator]
MLAARHRARLTMEERNVDQQEEVIRRNLRRRLFQDDEDDDSGQSTNSESGDGQTSNGENDNLANRLFEEARRNRENAKKRWNFDFENEVPLPGRYEWVRVDRDGNEISDFAQLKNGLRDSQEERPEGAAEEADAEEKE